MDYSLQQIIKQEKEVFKEDFEASLEDNPPSFYIDIIVQKQEHCDEYEWSYNALKNSFEETCSICGQIFKNRFILLQHNITHLNITLQPLNVITNLPKVQNKKHTKKHGQNITNSLHKCQHCNIMLPYKKWHAHKTVVHSEGNYECGECGEIYRCKAYLRKHMRKWHLKDKAISKSTCYAVVNVVCPICSAISKTRATFKVHVRNVHGDGPFQCEICGSKLKCFSYYLTHKRRVHYNDGKEHKCDMCHKKFKSPRYLRVHKKNSHEPNRDVKKLKIKKEPRDV
ncbi:hypothetical protein K1T71_014405 [Dendrolimus kikuchii]|uniref:Uncharacterized protein n=1 Tax=Dendrolimus kikuchii TaxID=765133 RepID=A0ACC1CDZ3_9NEOP|nr:hypothetical protein K1T71_014405 [Dendrolimus kikuchii]